eukprot:g4841.t1
MQSNANNRLEDRYSLVDSELGSGQYATVVRAVNKKTKREVAVKKILKARSKRANLDTEIEILKRFGHHKHIVDLYDVYETAEHIFLAMELMRGGELFDALVENGPYDEGDASRHIRDIGSALHFLHSEGIVHRDLKPENLLLTTTGRDARLKIADFGLSKILEEEEMMKTACGTWAYCAPEVLRIRRDHVGSYDAKCDMFSVGVILFVILSGYHPFDPAGENTDKQMQRLILEGRQGGAKELVRCLLEADPAKRLSAAQMLLHPWVKGTVLRGKLSATIDKDIGVYRQRMRKKLKVGFKAVHSLMTIKQGPSKRRSALEREAAASKIAEAANPVAEAANPVAEEGTVN